ncbi:hypothetical protein TEA_014160 [Camellia sinensis var. sinensis]|uniref:Subtilisin-like protease fibronectin type-III domain-containing protein n=1 Tax=Camellia sinensis var. sinensis TaxID=542762 RepID=A0A4S4DTD3_CAMSN|nr:hypothetical protein TEA_014160 [Camellia sinensis var. sinensis]
MVSSFSSRGPSLASPSILKPDVIGPSVNILAAWPISVENKTNSRLTFNTVSGTSMSCPHLSGIAALLKSAHPNWSPAAIKPTYTRTVTNVGEANSTYDSVIVAPLGVNVTLNATRLEFSEVNQKITYQVTFSRVATGGDASFVHGILSWTSSNSIQFVRSPVSVKLVRGK